jgi:U3 small nucleolar RNA-associated protein 12
MQVRVWDLDTQHCMQTVVGHRGEVWALAVDPQERRLVTGSVDQQLRVYTIADEDSSQTLQIAASADDADDTDTLPPASRPSRLQASKDASEGPSDGASDGAKRTDVLTLLGTVQRQSNDRVVTLEYDEAGEILACQAANKSVELYRVRGACLPCHANVTPVCILCDANATPCAYCVTQMYRRCAYCVTQM